MRRWWVFPALKRRAKFTTPLARREIDSYKYLAPTKMNTLPAHAEFTLTCNISTVNLLSKASDPAELKLDKEGLTYYINEAFNP
jgi:hypothetical protein